MQLEGQYDAYLGPETHSSETCENCYNLMPEGSGQLVEVHTYFGRVETLNVCKDCCQPIEIEIVWLSFQKKYWVLYITGMGSSRKRIEAYGDDKEEVVEKFKERYAEVMNRDLVNIIIK